MLYNLKSYSHNPQSKSHNSLE